MPAQRITKLYHVSYQVIDSARNKVVHQGEMVVRGFSKVNAMDYATVATAHLVEDVGPNAILFFETFTDIQDNGLCGVLVRSNVGGIRNLSPA